MYLTGSDTPSSLSVTNSQTKKLIMPTVNSLLKMDSLMPPTWKASWSPRRRKEKNKLILFFNFKILLPFFIFRQNTIETNLKKNNVSQASFDSKTTLLPCDIIRTISNKSSLLLFKKSHKRSCLLTPPSTSAQITLF